MILQIKPLKVGGILNWQLRSVILVDGEPVFSLLGEKKSPLGLQGGFVRLYATVRRLEDKQAYLRISPMGTSAYHVATSAFSEHKLEFHITRLLRTWVTQE